MIVGVSGKIGSGKDEFATTLMALQPEANWQVKKFAGKLKQIATIITGVPIEKWEDPEFKKEIMPDEWNKVIDGYLGHSSVRHMTYRELLQKLGTDAMRVGLHTNTWINALFADYKPERIILPDDPTFIKEDFPNWIVTDVRFENEAQAIRDRGGKLIRLHRDEDTGDHPSETALDNWKDWDAQIDNTGDLESFKEDIKFLAEYLF